MNTCDLVLAPTPRLLLGTENVNSKTQTTLEKPRDLMQILVVRGEEFDNPDGDREPEKILFVALKECSSSPPSHFALKQN